MRTANALCGLERELAFVTVAATGQYRAVMLHLTKGAQ